MTAQHTAMPEIFFKRLHNYWDEVGFHRENRRLEFELGAGFKGSCGLALVLALSQMREHGLGPFGRADLHPRRNPLERQGRFAPQPGSAGQLVGAPCAGEWPTRTHASPAAVA